MSLTNFPSGVSSFGIPLLGSGPIFTTGNVWWVNAAGPLGDGTSSAGTLATTQLAVTSAAAGDTIIVMAGHTEAISTATACVISKAGLQIVGMGIGSRRPTITLDTIATATISVTAANVQVMNILFVANFADIAGCFTTTAAANLNVQTCEFRDTDATHNFLAVVKTSTTDAAADGLTMSDSIQISAGLTANTAVLDLRANLARLTFQRNRIQSLVAGNSALIYQATTTKVLTTVNVSSNVLNFTGANAATGVLLITTATTHTGIVAGNFVWGARAAATAILVTASSGLKFFENYYQTVADKSGILNPANV